MKLDEAITAWRAADRAEAAIGERLRRSGWHMVRPRWVQLLQWIAANPGGSHSHLMREIGVRNLSYDLSRLAELGLLTSAGDRYDRRIKRLDLTPSGHALLAAIEAAA